jgi:hypothetical protein
MATILFPLHDCLSARDLPDKQSIWDGEETAEDPDEDDDYLWFLFLELTILGIENSVYIIKATEILIKLF